MPRVSKRQVLRGYAQSNVEPTKRRWAYISNQQMFCCPLSAAVIDAVGPEAAGGLLNVDTAWAMAEGALGLDRQYIAGYLDGVDGHLPDVSEWAEHEYGRGAFDGQQAAKAVFGG